ncbi:MAG: SDR family oxidoreductase [Rhizobiales bacterium TMED94]|nr:short-chain dehydrogenase [Rhodobiaceae bacterium]RPF88745.1 MAG: SDR family oxidoreductase [Rhizobiales bacterium TMED94]
MKSFKDKVAVITGAGSGMGRELAINLAKENCNVVICDINKKTIQETEEIIRKYNVSCTALNLDLREERNISTLLETTLKNFSKVDLLFNNAGVVAPSSFLNLSEKDWDWCNDINFNALVKLTRIFLPHLMKNEEAALINTSSIFGIITTPNNTVYHSSKFAVRGFTESLAMELRDEKIQIHSVYPGHIGTNIVLDAKFDKDFLSTNDNKTEDSDNEPITIQEFGSTFRDTGMDPDKAAKIILKGVKKNKKRIFVGLDAKVMEIAQRITPSHFMKLIPFLNLLIFPYFIKRFKMTKVLLSVLRAKKS